MFVLRFSSLYSQSALKGTIWHPWHPSFSETSTMTWQKEITYPGAQGGLQECTWCFIHAQQTFPYSKTTYEVNRRQKAREVAKDTAWGDFIIFLWTFKSCSYYWTFFSCLLGSRFNFPYAFCSHLFHLFYSFYLFFSAKVKQQWNWYMSSTNNQKKDPQTAAEYFCSFLPPHFQCPGIPAITEDQHISGTASLTCVSDTCSAPQQKLKWDKNKSVPSHCAPF